MRVPLAAILLLLLSPASHPQTPMAFDELFLDKALRLECTFAGDAKEQSVTVDRLVEEPLWPESATHLLNPFDNGQYALEVFDVATNALLYRRGFDSMFGEYTTTGPAIAGTKRTMGRALRIPFPKGPVTVVISKRDRDHIPHPMLVRRIDPASAQIARGTAVPGDETFETMRTGTPRERVDLVFLSEGYTREDRAKFEADVRRASAWLWEVEPYRGLKGRFNIRGVFRPSADRGVSQPKQGLSRNTALQASFDAFSVDRYLLTEAGLALRDMAAEVPYDAIVILVNSDRYGGGGIYNDYCITTVDNARSRMVFVHEFGHAFAGLADEYYLADVAYNDLYPKGVEPLEPNITAFLDPGRPKWRDLLSPGIALPTPWGKVEMDQIQGEMDRTRVAERQALSEAKAAKAPESKQKAIQKRYGKALDDLAARQVAVRKRYPGLEDKVGLFEGAAYTSEGMFRSQMFCLMGNSPKGEFCKVCQRAIARAVDFQSGP